MQWQICEARNGESTLKLNGMFIYSNYQPYKSAEQWIKTEVNLDTTHFFLIGLGLGYHLRALAKLATNKLITVYYFDEAEYELFKLNNIDLWWKQKNIRIVKHLKGINMNDIQLLLPNVWLKALHNNHPLFNLLEVIKFNQISYNKNAEKMLVNFQLNMELNDGTIKNSKQNKIACLVAAGPSLNETVGWLKINQNDLDIFVVGAALKMLLANGINPKATVLSDVNDVTISQFVFSNFKGELYYLSTANNKSILLHEGKRIVLYQHGYDLAERRAKEINAPVVETGGSVGTTTFSLLEQLGYEYIVLFGQDLGFEGNYSHAALSTSGRVTSKELFLRKIEANDGSEIKTTAMLQTFLYWYNEKMKETRVKVFNTAKKGAKIYNVPLIKEEEFIRLISYQNKKNKES